MVHTFTHPVYPELLVVIASPAGRRRSWRAADLLAWFGDRWAARAGYPRRASPGCSSGPLANDSGSVLLVIGTIYLAVVRRLLLGHRRNGRLTRRPLMGTIEACA